MQFQPNHQLRGRDQLKPGRSQPCSRGRLLLLDVPRQAATWLLIAFAGADDVDSGFGAAFTSEKVDLPPLLP